MSTNVETPAQEQPQANPALELVKNTTSRLQEVVPILQDKKTKACLALSKVVQVTSDEEDVIANNLLVKARATLEGGTTAEGAKTKGIVEMRMELTRPLDALKNTLIESEKAITEEMTRIKKLRDGYAQKKIDDAAAAAANAAKVLAQNNELSRVKGAFKQAIVDGQYKALQLMENNIRAHFNTMNLENWEGAAKRFTFKPMLKKELYDSFFAITYDPNLVAPEMFTKLVEQAKIDNPYEKVNEEYVKIAQPALDGWVNDTLPKRKKELEDLAELAKKDAAAAAARAIEIEAEQKQANEQKDAELQTQQKEATAEIIDTVQTEQLTNNFQAQVSIQSAGAAAPKGARIKKVAVFKGADDGTVNFGAAIYKVMMACMSHPKFEGIYKRKKGLRVPDENGVPVYADWLQPLLDFFANNCDITVDGIELKDAISTSARK
jgi:hypothetical protein